jgi:hypothetical protein
MDYKEIELHGRKLRYYSETHIEMENHGIKDNWKIKKIYVAKNKYQSFRIKQGTTSKLFYIHRIVFYAHNVMWDIYNSSSNNSIDHIDCNPSNNKIENLRNVRHQENLFNTKAKGYYLEKRTNKWVAAIKVYNKKIHLGYFDNEEDAHNSYLVAKEKYHLIVPKTF